MADGNMFADEEIDVHRFMALVAEVLEDQNLDAGFRATLERLRDAPDTPQRCETAMQTATHAFTHFPTLSGCRDRVRSLRMMLGSACGVTSTEEWVSTCHKLTTYFRGIILMCSGGDDSTTPER